MESRSPSIPKKEGSNAGADKRNAAPLPPKAPRNLTELRKLSHRPEALITPIKDEGKHQLPNDNGVPVRANSKEIREKQRLDFLGSSTGRTTEGKILIKQ